MTLQLPEAMQTFVAAQVKVGKEGSVGDDIQTPVHEDQQCQVQVRPEAKLLEGLVCVQ